MREDPSQMNKPRNELLSEGKRPALRQAILAALTAGSVLVGASDTASAKRHTPEEVSYSEYEKYYREHETLLRRWMAGSTVQRQAIGRSNPAFALNLQSMQEALDDEEKSIKKRAEQLATEYQDRHKAIVEDLERIDRSFEGKEPVEAILRISGPDRTDMKNAPYLIAEERAWQLWKEIAGFSRMFTPEEIETFKEYPNAQSLAHLRGIVDRMDEFLALEHSLRDRAMIRLRLEGAESLLEPYFGGPENDRG